jgi:hypothetical protein
MSSKKYYEKNKKIINEKCRKYNEKNREKIRKQRKESYEKNKKKVKKYIEKNKEKIKKYKKSYRKEKYKNEPIYRLNELLRHRIRDAIKSQSVIKSNRTIKLLGCNIEFYKDYLEKQFDSEMTWKNQGTYWVIDHIVPISSFDLTQESDQLLAFNWSNTRPLEKNKNLEKGDKFEVYTSEGVFWI